MTETDRSATATYTGPERRRTERRAPEEGRRYNRRSGDGTPPPYIETFDRIAVSLERIADRLEARGRELVMPEADPLPSEHPRGARGQR